MNRRSNQILNRWPQKVALGILLLGVFASRAGAQIGFPPLITVQPLDQTVQDGGNVTFLVQVTSITTMSYQWRFNGTNIPGATGATLITPIVYSRTNMQYYNAGKYSVAITNAAGYAISRDAVVTVINTPLRFASTETKSNLFRATVTGPVGANYVIFDSPNLKVWRPLSTNVAVNGTVEFAVPLKDGGIRFFRAMVQ